MTDNYGDIEYRPFKESTLEALKETSASLLAVELATSRGETYSDPVLYVSQWYQFDYQKRAWVPKGQ